MVGLNLVCRYGVRGSKKEEEEDVGVGGCLWSGWYEMTQTWP